MKNEIKIRKRRFVAAMLTFLLLLNQLPPIRVNADDYAVLQLSGKVVQAGDSLSNSLEDGTSDTYNVYYYDYDGASLDSLNASAENVHTVAEYPNNLTDAEFAGWYVNYVDGSGNDVYSVKLSARISYPITYIGIDGAANSNPSSYIYGEGVESLVEASKPGYTFDGWYSDEELTVKVGSIGNNQTGKKTLYAKFVQNPSYQISYELNGGSNGNNPDSYIQGIGTTLADASKEGHSFSGWYSDAEFNNSVTSVDASQTGDIKLYAKFTVNQYTITFDTDGGSTVVAITADYGAAVTAPASPTKTGYTFAGWDKEIPMTMPAENITITAQWTANKYAVKFVNEDGTELQSSEVSYGETPAYTGATPTKAATAEHSYTFAGWSPAITAVTGIATYTATFTESVNQYTITFDTNGGSAIAAITADYGTAVTAPASPTKTGYTFAGWDKEIPATMPAENITVTAQWTANKYTVTFVNEDGTELQSGEVAYGETPAYTGATPTKAATAEHSYTFAGWSPAITAVTGIATYTATFTESVNQYTITFDTNGGSAIAAITADYGTAVTAPASPTKTGYTFAGWDKEIPATMPAENITITAQWTANKYTVTFVNEDGTELQSSEVAYGETPAYTGATPTKAATAEHSYTFAGWSPAITAVTGIATYTATFTESVNQYTITFDTNGGSAIAAITADYGTAVTAPASPTKTGYTFAGWDKEIPATMPAENITITAQWTANKYTVTFVNEDGTELQRSEVAYGETPAYTGATPTKAATAEHSYTFAGWSPAITAITGEATYKATFTESTNQYTITFDTNGGSAIASITQDYGTTVTAPASPTKTGYTFASWDKEIPTTMPAENITITAHWTANSYSIHYTLDGGTNGANPSAYTYGTGVSSLADAVKPGYNFAGWYESADFSGKKVTSVAADRTGDIMLYAKFEMGNLSAGTYYLTAGVEYRLGNVTKVSGDSSVYIPGSTFYVSVSGSYTFS